MQPYRHNDRQLTQQQAGAVLMPALCVWPSLRAGQAVQGELAAETVASRLTDAQGVAIYAHDMHLAGFSNEFAYGGLLTAYEFSCVQHTAQESLYAVRAGAYSST